MPVYKDDRRDLTYREREILTLIKEGYSHKEIAGKLGIGAPTIKVSVRLILARLNARNTTHAVAIALREELIDLKDRGIQDEKLR
ncbi:unnamed protein product [marine sediment metagenome]|uniref:HTH luxR-type domain-containing protein n=1 Tax=marine sediment metagenome TaxID=412755 RepID=X1RA89_9ZZZZ